MYLICVQVRYTRAFKGLISPPSEPPGEIMSFGVSPVNYSDSDSDLISRNNNLTLQKLRKRQEVVKCPESFLYSFQISVQSITYQEQVFQGHEGAVQI